MDSSNNEFQFFIFETNFRIRNTCLTSSHSCMRTCSENEEGYGEVLETVRFTFMYCSRPARRASLFERRAFSARLTVAFLLSSESDALKSFFLAALPMLASLVSDPVLAAEYSSSSSLLGKLLR